MIRLYPFKSRAHPSPHRILFNGIKINHDTGKYAAGSISDQSNTCPILCFPSSPNPKHKNKSITKRKCAADNSIVNFVICI